MSGTATGAEGADEDVFARSAAGKPMAAEESWSALPPGRLLSVAEADALLRRRPARVVAVVGERNGGKTTLITEIYGQLLLGPFAGHSFAHSLSLLGFEQRSFQARAGSGATRPDTPRTSARDGLLFFHLALTNECGLRRTDLLISERAGEAYRAVRDRPAETIDLIEVTRARTVAFILDGERLIQDRLRAEAFASTRNMLRAFADSGAIQPDADVQIVTTKYDLLPNGPSAVQDALSEFEDRLIANQAGRFRSVAAFRTAARDLSGSLGQAWGIAPLLHTWLASRPATVSAAAPAPELRDEFDRLLVRRTA